MSAQKWVRSSLARLSRAVTAAGHPASAATVGRLLRRQDYALHVNSKRVEGAAGHPDRDAQFTYLWAQRQAFQAAGLPLISVDTKKKELIGTFKNAGRSWSASAVGVNVHDFPGDALGRAVPYGIYDLTRNRGLVAVGQSADTPRFAVAAITHWWVEEGRAAYPAADRLFVLADAGGSNNCRARRWKQHLQELADRFGLAVTVGHYPTGCSKWNPIEHRLFGPISTNWAGQPLRSWEGLLGWIRGTTTATGLTVRADLLPGSYLTGETATDEAMAGLNLERHAVCPTWNYTIRPRPRSASTASADRDSIL